MEFIKCPKCEFKLTPEMIECPRCGIILQKYINIVRRKKEKIKTEIEKDSDVKRVTKVLLNDSKGKRIARIDSNSGKLKSVGKWDSQSKEIENERPAEKKKIEEIPVEQPNKIRKINFKKWITISLAIIGLMLGISGVAIYKLSQTPENRVNEFLEYMQNGQHLKIQESLSKELYEMVIMFGAISDKTLEKHYQTNQMYNYSVSEIEKTNKSARYKVTITKKNGHKVTETIDLVLQDSEWKISSF